MPDSHAADRADPAAWRLFTAEILYHLPDHPAVLQSYVWQQFDLAPRFPRLHRFLAFWEREIEGRLHSVRVGARLLLPAEPARAGGATLSLH